MATAKAIKGTRKTTAVLPPDTVSSPAVDYASVLEEIEAELHRNVGEWLPRAVDDKGGFFQAFDRDWKRPKKEDPRFVVYQARMTWVAATYLALESKTRKSFQNYAQHGLAFLSTRQWDLVRGGFYDHVAKDGKPVTEGLGQIKSIYGNAFGVYALAALYRSAGDLFALDLGFEAFEWIDSFAHDDVNGGYFNAIALDGKPLPADAAGANHDTKSPGIKLANTHIHLLEAFVELLRAAPHTVVQERVQELVSILRDKLATPEGYVVERVTEDWQPLSKTTSFGHDVETAFLLMDAAEVLGTQADERTRNVARSLVDHALKFGFNEKTGALAHSADLKGKILDPATWWWDSAEALNAFLLMHELFGSETDKYWTAFVAQWNFIKNHHIDAEHGGWYEIVDAEGKPTGTHKANGWKEPYHETRAMLHVVERLKRLKQVVSG